MFISIGRKKEFPLFSGKRLFRRKTGETGSWTPSRRQIHQRFLFQLPHFFKEVKKNE